jgi:hypothetical protein
MKQHTPSACSDNQNCVPHLRPTELSSKEINMEANVRTPAKLITLLLRVRDIHAYRST